MQFKQYPSYKDSGVEWLGEVPEHWRISSLKRYGYFKGGAGFPHAYQGNTEENIPFFKVNSLSKDKRFLSSFSDFVGEETAKKLGAKIFPKNSIFFAKVGAALLLERIRTNQQPCCIDNNMMGFVIQNELSFDFAFYLMSLIDFKYLVNPGAVPSINESQISSFLISVPPISEQTQIANYLDTETARIDNLIAKQEKLIELLEEQRKSIISHAVTKGLNPNAPMKDSGVEWLGKVPNDWNLSRLDAVSKIVRGNSAFSKMDLLESGKYVALQYGKTYKVNEINESFGSYVNQEFFKKSQITEFGDIILISTSETLEDLGHSCFYARHDVGLIGGEQFLLKPKNQNFGKYIYYATKAFSSYLQRYATGLKVFRFNLDDLKKIYIPDISLVEQQKIAEFLDKETARIDISVLKQKSLIEKLKEYRASIISHAVTGKIDVREFGA